MARWSQPGASDRNPAFADRVAGFERQGQVQLNVHRRPPLADGHVDSVVDHARTGIVGTPGAGAE